MSIKRLSRRPTRQSSTDALQAPIPHVEDVLYTREGDCIPSSENVPNHPIEAYRMSDELIKQLVLAAMPRVNIEKWLDSIIYSVRKWNIEDKRLCMFLAQIGHESSDLNNVVENLNYSTEALLRLFGRHRISVEDAKRYGRNGSQPANQEMLANILYGGEWGIRNLGNTQEGDGWRYRGRGSKQITGRSNYKDCGEALGVDLINNPELLERDKRVCVECGCWFFVTRTTGVDILQVTRQINGGTNGLEDRRQRFERALKVLRQYS